MRYVVADEQSTEWSHIFDEVAGEVTRECKFVYDTEDEQVHSMRIRRDGEWGLPSRSEMNDLEDSLKGANPEALDNPESYGLRTSDEIPDWASEIPVASPGM